MGKIGFFQVYIYIYNVKRPWAIYSMYFSPLKIHERLKIRLNLNDATYYRWCQLLILLFVCYLKRDEVDWHCMVTRAAVQLTVRRCNNQRAVPGFNPVSEILFGAFSLPLPHVTNSAILMQALSKTTTEIYYSTSQVNIVLSARQTNVHNYCKCYFQGANDKLSLHPYHSRNV